MERVVEMVFDLEIKEKFNDIDGSLKEHDNRIKSLELEFAKTNITLDYLKESHDELKQSMKSLENTVVQNNNITLTSLNQLNSYLITKETNDTQKLINQNNNDTAKKISIADNLGKIVLGLIGLAGTIIGSIYAGSKLIN